MAKKSSKQNKLVTLRILAIFLVFSLLILGLVLFKQPAKPTVKQVLGQEATQATSSATPISNTPKPTPINLLPAQYGKSVKVPILTYHYIGNNPNPRDSMRDNLSVSPDKFESQMNYLAQAGYSPIILDTLYGGLMGNISLPPKPIVLTFDDGYIDFYVNAYPILRRHNFHAVSFIPTGLIGQGYYLNWSQILEMDQSGLISFQAHTVNHTNLTLLSPDQIKYQISESKKVLQAHLGHQVNFFAYPYGASNSLTWSTVKEAGFIGAAGTWAGDFISEETIFDMPRIKIGNWDVNTFASRI